MYVEELSNYVNTLEPAPVPDWHWEILDRRMADPREALENGITWEEFEKELKRT